MAKHELNIHVVDTMNTCILKVQDLSVYSNIVQYTCPALEILLPGFKKTVVFNDTTAPTIAKNFDINITACDLGLQLQNCNSEFAALPDGIYALRYSVSPNEYVNVEINHLRVTSLMHKYKEALCDLDIAGCEPSQELKKKQDLLNTVFMYIEAAKAKAEYCLEPKKAMELYNYAKKLLDSINCKTC